MKIGILQTGLLAPELAVRFGEYPPMFRDLYHAVDPSIPLTSYGVVNGEMPGSPHDCDAWLITGSKHGVQDGLPWIEPLKEFLRTARSVGVPMIGICFGHQVMAEAFGGRAEMSDKGWGCGVHGYSIGHRPGWLASASDAFAMHAMHQDQVTRIPDDATCHASSDFCEYAMVSYGDPERPDAISIQPHPEMSREFAEAVIDLRAGTTIPPERAEAGRASLGTPVADLDFVRWSLDYLRQRLGADSARAPAAVQ